mgnify:FL=1
MYIYTIYEEKGNQKVKLDFICSDQDNQTLSELEKTANKRLAELQKEHSNPSAIKMKRKLTPLL